MKKFFLFSILLLLAQNTFAIDYYYYNGTRIDLKRRDDKVIVVTNMTGQNKAQLENSLKLYLDAGDELKFAYDNTYQIVFKDGPSASKVQSYVNRFSMQSNMVKFTAPAYFPDNYKITIISADEFIVKLKNDFDRGKLDLLNAQYGAQIIESFPGSRQFNIKTFNGNAQTALDLSDIYLQSGIFEYCEPNFVYPDYCLLHATTNDTYFSSQWPLNNTGQRIFANMTSDGLDSLKYSGLSGSDMEVTLAWDYTTGSNLLEVGVVDTGIDSTHPDLRTNLLVGYDGAYNVNSVPRDSNSHGTCTGGIIGALGNNSLGIAGIAYGCKIRSYRIFNGAGSAANTYIIRVFNRAKTNGAAIMSNSWGGGSPNTSLTQAIDSCAQYGNSGKGCVVLFSTGNEGRNPPDYPSTLSSVVAVGASTAYDQKKAPANGMQFWWGGNYGNGYYFGSIGDIECVAPTITVSTDVQSTGGYNDSTGTAGNYSWDFNGTSCSCPNAAGVAALIYSVNTGQTASQVISALLQGCDKIDNIAYDSTKTYGTWNSYFGYGRVNAYNSVRLAAGADVTPPSIVHENVESHSSTYPTTITATITDIGGTVNTSSAKILYRTNKNNAGWSSFDSTTATTNAGSSFTFKIPGQGWETQVQYYIKAQDNTGNTGRFPIHAPDTTNLCYYAVGSIQIVTQKISGPTSIPTAGSVFTGTTSFASFKILKTKVRTYLRHNRVSDINVSLFGPNSNLALNAKCMFSENPNSGAASTGITNATVVDSANQFWQQVSQPYTGGFFKPEYSFRGLNGTSASGNWRLLIYDGATGTGGTFDSCFVTFYRTSGTTSSSAGFNTAADSIVTFNGTNTDTVNFYLKNRGTASLTISGSSFSGTYASKFSLLQSPASIAAGDSGLFKIRCNPLAPRPKGGDPSVLDDAENATLDITTNDPSKPTLHVSLQTPAPLPVELANFTYSVDKNNATLNWNTLFEQNNAGFDVERKASEINEWVKAGNVTGAGNSNVMKNYSFSDINLSTGKYSYRLKQIDFNGNYKYYDLSNEVIIGVPTKYDISQNYPNPFNPSTKVNFDLPFDSRVQIKVFDMTGREIAQMLNETKTAGYYTMQFNASALASGVYFYQIQATGGSQSFVKTMKMVLVK